MLAQARFLRGDESKLLSRYASFCPTGGSWKKEEILRHFGTRHQADDGYRITQGEVLLLLRKISRVPS